MTPTADIRPLSSGVRHGKRGEVCAGRRVGTPRPGKMGTKSKSEEDTNLKDHRLNPSIKFIHR